MKSGSPGMSTSKIVDLNSLLQDLNGKRNIVFTNGCFDILHAGHVQYLEAAAELGDILVVGLNSDASVKRLKGSSRPINNQTDRAIVLAGLGAVNYVIIFDEDTPYELIKAIQPDILVKGGDWKVIDIVGTDIVQAKGGKVISLPFRTGLSTTNLINALQGSK
jgi:rfaE bifunctional protein nucleotidyltransferase chain/domain